MARSKPPAIRATVKLRVDGRVRQAEKRFPLGTSDAVITRWKDETWAQLKVLGETPKPAPVGTRLRDDIAAYLALLPAGQRQKDTAALLSAWARTHGDTPRAQLTGPAIFAQMLAWHRDGKAAQTVNHRRRALLGLYTTLDGPSAPNPAREAQKLRTPRSKPRGLPWATVEAILTALTDRKGRDKTRLRLWVIATTGWPHSVVAGLTPDRLHLDAPTPYAVISRDKGDGVDARAVPLTPRAVEALRAFAAGHAWGKFSRHSMWKTFRRAVEKVGAPTSIRPYDLRHSYGTALYAATRDIRATQELMLHASMHTTAQYAHAAVSVTAQAAVAALAGTVAGTGPIATKQARKRR